MTGCFNFIHKSTKNLPDKTTPLNLLFWEIWQHFRDVSKSKLFIKVQFDYSFPLQFLFISGGCPCSLKNPVEPLFSSFLPNCVTHWPIGITTPLRKRLEKNKCGHVYAATIWALALVKSHPQHVSCVLQRETAHFLLHPTLRWSLIGSTGCSDIYGYNLTVSYCRWGGKVFPSWGWGGLALLPPSPIQRCFAWSNPKKECGTAGPLSVVNPFADGWGSVVAAVLRGRCPSLGSQEFGRRTKHPLPISSPQCGPVLLFQHPRPAGLWWISKPLLDQRYEAA